MKSMVKIYEKMKPEELARIAYSALAEGNEGEYLKIISSVPRHVYDAPDSRYTNTFNNIWSLTHIWGTEYWRLMFISAQSGLMSCQSCIERERSRQLMEESASAYARIIAHVGAMKRLCQDYSIPLQAVSKLTGVRFESFDVHEPVDGELLEQAYRILKGAFLSRSV